MTITEHTIGDNGQKPLKFGSRIFNNASIHIEFDVDGMKVDSLTVEDLIEWQEAARAIDDYDPQNDRVIDMPLKEAIKFLSIFVIDKNGNTVHPKRAKNNLLKLTGSQIMEVFNLFSVEFANIQASAVNPPTDDPST